MGDDRRRDVRLPGDPAEGVRIIGAEEAAEAIERGDVAQRRGEHLPRYGDRPARPPMGPKPALRFPLDAGADPSDAPPVRPAKGTRFDPRPPPAWDEPAIEDAADDPWPAESTWGEAAAGWDAPHDDVVAWTTGATPAVDAPAELSWADGFVGEDEGDLWDGSWDEPTAALRGAVDDLAAPDVAPEPEAPILFDGAAVQTGPVEALDVVTPETVIDVTDGSGDRADGDADAQEVPAPARRWLGRRLFPWRDDGPSEDAPVEDAPVEDAPVGDAPVEDAHREHAGIERVGEAASEWREATPEWSQTTPDWSGADPAWSEAILDRSEASPERAEVTVDEAEGVSAWSEVTFDGPEDAPESTEATNGPEDFPRWLAATRHEPEDVPEPPDATADGPEEKVSEWLETIGDEPEDAPGWSEEPLDGSDGVAGSALTADGPEHVPEWLGTIGDEPGDVHEDVPERSGATADGPEHLPAWSGVAPDRLEDLHEWWDVAVDGDEDVPGWLEETIDESEDVPEWIGGAVDGPEDVPEGSEVTVDEPDDVREWSGAAPDRPRFDPGWSDVTVDEPEDVPEWLDAPSAEPEADPVESGAGDLTVAETFPVAAAWVPPDEEDSVVVINDDPDPEPVEPAEEIAARAALFDDDGGWADTPGKVFDFADEPSGRVALPHWTDPPTGELPRVLVGEDVDDPAPATSGSTPAVHWQGHDGRWGNEGFDDLIDDDEERVGALDDDRPHHDDVYAYDIDPEPVEEGPIAAPPPRVGRRIAPARPAPDAAPAAGRGAGRNVGKAVGVGVGAAAIALGAFWLGPAAALVLVMVILFLGVVEFQNAARRAGYRPATLIGLAAAVCYPLAVYWKGIEAYPLLAVMTVATILAWHLVGADGDARVVESAGVTLLGIGWVAGLGSVAALMLSRPDGVGILLAAVIAAVGYDIGGYAVGRTIGTRTLSDASPNKTIEGLVGGVVVALFAMVVFGLLEVAPFSGPSAALQIGLVAALAAPLGDLCESLIKRDLGVKDMGSILPEHGGILDRFDALLFVLPAVYYGAVLLSLGPFS
jgi:phosphatidate cytidylyltransferase